MLNGCDVTVFSVHCGEHCDGAGRQQGDPPRSALQISASPPLEVVVTVQFAKVQQKQLHETFSKLLVENS